MVYHTQISVPNNSIFRFAERFVANHILASSVSLSQEEIAVRTSGYGMHCGQLLPACCTATASYNACLTKPFDKQLF